MPPPHTMNAKSRFCGKKRWSIGDEKAKTTPRVHKIETAHRYSAFAEECSAFVFILFRRTFKMSHARLRALALATGGAFSSFDHDDVAQELGAVGKTEIRTVRSSVRMFGPDEVDAFVGP